MRLTARVVAGMHTMADYHFGSFVGNIGLDFESVRLSSPAFITYDEDRDILLVPSMYGRTIVVTRRDFAKACEIDLRGVIKTPAHALLLEDGRLAVADSTSHDIVLFDAPDFSCLDRPPQQIAFTRSR